LEAIDLDEKYVLPDIYKQQLLDQRRKIAQLKDLIKRLKLAGVDVTEDEVKLIEAENKLNKMMDAFEVK